MIEVLLFSRKDVKQRLLEQVRAERGLLLVTGVRHGAHMRAVEEREPFAGLEREFGALLHQLVVADDGTVEGMWRDPLGDLGDVLYPGDARSSYAAATGYVVMKEGVVEAVVRKRADVAADRWHLQEALAAADRRIPRPSAKDRPREADQGAAPPPPRASVAPPAPDPWQVLGLERGASLAEARKVFRELAAQYHPDKVAHLAPEFRALADERTRQLVAAWEQIKKSVE